MDNLVSLLHAVGPAAVNSEVRSKILELIQTWSTATDGRHDLIYIGEVYKTLQREGFQFPPRITVASSMIDSSAVSSLDLNPLIAILVAFQRSLLIHVPDYSPQNGLIQMSACDVERHLHLRIESTTAATVATVLTSNARPNLYLCHTLESFSLFVSMMAAMRS
jgi:hypothetical protein